MKKNLPTQTRTSGNFVFLEAEWRKLMMINYAVDPKLLGPWVPHKTEIDLWKGTCYISLVGFMFLDTKVKGWKIPFHVNFEEINLRFYVRHHNGKEWKRGVVFFREIVPKPALTFVANTLYGEHYETMPMKHHWATNAETQVVQYAWKKKNWNTIQVIAESTSQPITGDSEEAFITEHYWGYTRISDRKTSEYKVEHPSWEVYKTLEHRIDVDFGAIYGQAFDFLKAETPKSVFLAEGSAIKVMQGQII